MKKKLDLCGRCAEIFAETYSVEREAPRGCDKKVTCSCCKKRRWGGTYRIESKTKKNSQ